MREDFLNFSVSSVERLEHSVLNARPLRPFSNRNNGKYVDRRSNAIVTHQKMRNELLKSRVSIVYLQLNFNEIQNDYLVQTLVS